jgi:hypothetical protein
LLSRQAANSNFWPYQGLHCEMITIEAHGILAWNRHKNVDKRCPILNHTLCHSAANHTLCHPAAKQCPIVNHTLCCPAAKQCPILNHQTIWQFSSNWEIKKTLIDNKFIQILHETHQLTDMLTCISYNKCIWCVKFKTYFTCQTIKHYDLNTLSNTNKIYITTVHKVWKLKNYVLL